MLSKATGVFPLPVLAHAGIFSFPSTPCHFGSSLCPGGDGRPCLPVNSVGHGLGVGGTSRCHYDRLVEDEARLRGRVREMGGMTKNEPVNNLEIIAMSGMVTVTDGREWSSVPQHHHESTQHVTKKRIRIFVFQRNYVPVLSDAPLHDEHVIAVEEEPNFLLVLVPARCHRWNTV